jgi:hypothetical protein
MVEDCHTSYDSGYGGGLRQPGTFIEFAKRKIDELNRFYTHSHADCYRLYVHYDWHVVLR